MKKTQHERILEIFLEAPSFKVSGRYLRRDCGFNEANARITELNDEWREKGWDVRIENIGRDEHRFVLHQLKGDTAKLTEKLAKPVIYVKHPFKDELITTQEYALL